MIAYLARALKTPTIARGWDDLAALARDASWSSRGVPRRGPAAPPGRRPGVLRHRDAHPHRALPAVKTLEDFNLDHLPVLRRDVLAHLATGTFVPKAENVIFLGPTVIAGLILI